MNFYFDSSLGEVMGISLGHFYFIMINPAFFETLMALLLHSVAVFRNATLGHFDGWV